MARATNVLLLNNTYAVYELLKNTLKNNEDVLYIFVVDPQGNVLAHTFGEVFPKELLKANAVAGADNYHLAVFRTEIGIVRDVAVPILNGLSGGTVCLSAHGCSIALPDGRTTNAST